MWDRNDVGTRASKIRGETGREKMTKKIGAGMHERETDGGRAKRERGRLRNATFFLSSRDFLKKKK